MPCPAPKWIRYLTSLWGADVRPLPCLACPGFAHVPSRPGVAPVAQKVEHSVFHRGGAGSYPTRSNFFFLSPPAWLSLTTRALIMGAGD
jgi:hypothetical protein